LRKRVKDYGIEFGSFSRGKYNSITDVPGVKVGHCTIRKDIPIIVRTGVTVVIPGEGDVYNSPVFAAAHVINGFGKSIGLVQIEELGSIETPILLTNTLNVGIVADALVEYILRSHPNCTTVNPVVCECNDGKLNDIRTRSVKKENVFSALQEVQSGVFETGSVGAGTGMICYGYKGGIGTSSRVIMLDESKYTIGVLTLTNFGKREELTIKGIMIDDYFKDQVEETEDGSIIIIIGTDIPLTHRQLKRIAKRTSIGIARTGGRCSNSSGEICVAFSNSNRRLRSADRNIYTIKTIAENAKVTSLIFDAVIDGVEEAIIDSLFTAEAVKGRNGKVARALPVEEFISLFQRRLRFL